MNKIDGAYYIDFSLPSLMTHSITIWTNLFSLRDEIRYETCGMVEVMYKDDEHMVLDVTPMNYECLAELIQLCRDCVTVENMLEGVEVTL